jgi:hypothetical protein
VLVMAANNDDDDIYADDDPSPLTGTPANNSEVKRSSPDTSSSSSSSSSVPSSSSNASSSASPTVWPCSSCTYENALTRVRCEICDHPRPGTRTTDISGSSSSSSNTSTNNNGTSIVARAAAEGVASISAALASPSPSSSPSLSSSSSGGGGGSGSWVLTPPSGYTGPPVPSVFNQSNLAAMLMVGKQALRDRVMGLINGRPGEVPTTTGTGRRIALMRPDGTILHLRPDDMEPNSLYQITAMAPDGRPQYIQMTGQQARDLAAQARASNGQPISVSLPFADTEAGASTIGHRSAVARAAASAQSQAVAIQSGELPKTHAELEQEEIESLADGVAEHELNGGLEEFKTAIEVARNGRSYCSTHSFSLRHWT